MKNWLAAISIICLLVITSLAIAFFGVLPLWAALTVFDLI